MQETDDGVSTLQLLNRLKYRLHHEALVGPNTPLSAPILRGCGGQWTQTATDESGQENWAGLRHRAASAGWQPQIFLPTQTSS